MHAAVERARAPPTAALGLVAFESFTYSTPPTSATCSRRCGEAGELAQSAVAPRPGRCRAPRHTAAAAIALSRLCGRAAARRGLDQGSPRHSVAGSSRRSQPCAAEPDAAGSVASAGVHDRDIRRLAGWRRCAASRRGSRRAMPWRSRWSSEQVQEHGRLGRERRRVLELEARCLADDRRRRVERRRPAS